MAVGRMRRMRPFALLCLLALAGCGGSGEGTTAAATTATTQATTPGVTETKTTTATRTTRTVLTVIVPEETANASEKPTGKPTFVVTLQGESATPVAGRAWRYVVTARRSAGGPAGGTAKMRVFVGGELVDTLGHFSFDGRLTRTYAWSPVLKGKQRVVLQAEVEGDGGTRRANFPVTVR